MDTFLIEKFTPPINCAFVPSTRDFGGARSGQAVLNSVLNSVVNSVVNSEPAIVFRTFN
jgi:hypothetical protein